MNTKSKRLIAMAIIINGCSTNTSVESELLGAWKSDAQRTLSNMRLTEGITSEARGVFEDDFFGHLVIEYRSNEMRVYFDDDEDDPESEKDYFSYKLISETQDVFIVQYHDAVAGKNETKTYIREGSCYWLPVTKWEFREYFCKIQ